MSILYIFYKYIIYFISISYKSGSIKYYNFNLRYICTYNMLTTKKTYKKRLFIVILPIENERNSIIKELNNYENNRCSYKFIDICNSTQSIIDIVENIKKALDFYSTYKLVIFYDSHEIFHHFEIKPQYLSVILPSYNHWKNIKSIISDDEVDKIGRYKEYLMINYGKITILYDSITEIINSYINSYNLKKIM